MNGCRRRARSTILAQWARRSSGVISVSNPVSPDGLEFTLEDARRRMARVLSAHGRARQPLLAELTEALSSLIRRLSRCFSMGGTAPRRSSRFRVNIVRAPWRARSHLGHTCQKDGLAPAIQPVVEPERDAACGCDAHIHCRHDQSPCTFLLWFQALECRIRQHSGPPRAKRRHAVFGGFRRTFPFMFSVLG